MKVEIKDQNLAEYVMFKLDKNINIFTEDELSSIDEIFLDCHELNNFKINELSMFPNIEKLTLRNFRLNIDDFYTLLMLKKLTDIVFDNCIISKPKLISGLNITKLSLINCNIHNYDFVYIMDTLQELTIIRGNINIGKINRLERLKYLQLSYCNITDVNIALNLLSLNELHIDNTNIHNLKFTDHLYNLKILSIDETQYNNNLSTVENLEENNVVILNEGLPIERGDSNE